MSTTAPQTPRINGNEDRWARWNAAQEKIHTWNNFVEELNASIERLPESARTWMDTATGCFPQFVRERILHELIGHFECIVEELQAKGLSEEHAQQQALRQLGSARAARRKYLKEHLTTDERTLRHRLQLRHSGDIKHTELSWFGIGMRVVFFIVAATVAVYTLWICLAGLFEYLPQRPAFNNQISFWQSPVDWYVNNVARLHAHGPEVPLFTALVAIIVSEFFLPTVLGCLYRARSGGEHLRRACRAAVILFASILVIDVLVITLLVVVQPYGVIFVTIALLTWLDYPPNVYTALRVLRWISNQDEAAAT